MDRSSRGRPLRIAVIGAGMAGILSAIKLREAGHGDFVVYEKASKLGGTWRENTYPGIACDVPSHLYSYSFAPNPDWSHRFSPGDEIQAYFEGVARRYGVSERIRFGSALSPAVAVAVVELARTLRSLLEARRSTDPRKLLAAQHVDDPPAADSAPRDHLA